MTAIEWTDATWNPTTGCDRVSPGCDHCYAMTLAKRLKAMGQAKYQTDGDPRTSGPGFGLAVHEDTLPLPLTWRKPRRVFVNSMSDLFHEKVPDQFIASVFAVMAVTPRHTFQVLTKRHGRLRSLLSSETFRVWTYAAQRDLAGPDAGCVALNGTWPLPNVWLGVSVEDQHWADIRIPALLDTPAAVRFLSCEPLLGPMSIYKWVQRDDPDGECQTCGNEEWTGSNGHPEVHYCVDGICTVAGGPDCDEAGEETGTWCPGPVKRYPRLDWVITGGESGPGFRPADPEWFRSIRDQCVAAGVAYLHKQHGGIRPKSNGRLLDGRTWDQYPDGAP